MRRCDIDGFVEENAGIEAVLTASDVPGENAFGVVALCRRGGGSLIACFAFFFERLPGGFSIA